MYLPYEDSEKIRERVKILHDLDYTTSAIAEAMGISPARVSYYKRRLGIARKKAESTRKTCVVCRKAFVEPGLQSVCRDHHCIIVMIEAVNCQLPQDEADIKFVLDIYPKSFGIRFPDSAVICTRMGVTRVFSSAEEHIRYHAYAVKANSHRPPSAMWVNEGELKVYKMRLADAKYASRNLNSEFPQPRRMRSRKK